MFSVRSCLLSSFSPLWRRWVGERAWPGKCSLGISDPALNFVIHQRDCDSHLPSGTASDLSATQFPSHTDTAFIKKKLLQIRTFLESLNIVVEETCHTIEKLQNIFCDNLLILMMFLLMMMIIDMARMIPMTMLTLIDRSE